MSASGRPGMPIADLIGIALPHGGTFLMLRAYFDDSGSHSYSDAVVVGGVVGTPKQFMKLESDWAAKLRQPLPGKPSLRQFSLADCNARKGEFIDYSPAESDALMHDMRQVLIDADLIGVASAVDKKAWNELVIGAHRNKHGSDIEVCLQNCVMDAIGIANAHPEGDDIAIVCDRGIWTQRIKDITDPFTHVLGKPRIRSVVFSVVADTFGLQGADTIAGEAYRHAVSWIKDGPSAPPRAHLKHFLERMKMESKILDRAAIAQIVSPDSSGSVT